MNNHTQETIYMGIDVHKDSYSVTVISNGTLIKRDKISASPKQLLTYCKNFKGAKIKTAYEAGFSGFYLHRFLIAHGIENIVVDPASIEISRNNVKTDKRDSLKIATQLSDGRLSCVYIPSIKREDKRHLTRLREQFVKYRNRVSCQIKSLLHLHGLIEAHSSPRVTQKWMSEIFSRRLNKNLKISLEVLFQTWKYFNMQMAFVNNAIEEESKEDYGLEAIYCSFPGIGPTSARKLINELEDMSHFSNENKLFSYAGLTPREYSSGEHVRQGHITRQGKSVIRRILVEAAWVAIRKDPSLTIAFEKMAYRAGKKRAIVAIARILLGRIRTCLKEKRLYVISSDAKNTEVA